jgi:parvulin-like peptidyl-prolyl isomerase
MISLDKLRKRSGLVVGGIGVALGAFLLGDLMNSSSSILNGSQGVIGEVNDEVIEYRDFETEAQNLDRIYNTRQDRSTLRDNLWADKVNQIIMEEQYASLGLSVGSEELAGLTFGYKSAEMSNTAKQFFGISGQEVAPGQLATLIQQIHDNDPQRWLYFENLIRKERLAQKYNTLLRNGLFASAIDAEAYYNEQGTQASGRYVFKSFASVKDEEVEVTDAEVKSYYNNHIEDYPQDESRELRFAIFDIIPTEADKQAINNRLTELLEDKVVFNKNTKSNETISGFRNTTDAAAFVNEHADSSFDGTYYAEGQLSPAIESEMRNAEIGFVFGPYEEDNIYKLARLNDRRNDSIQVAIIDMAIDASEETANEIYAKASELAASNDVESLEAAADAQNIALAAASIQDDDRTIAGVGEARNLVFWAYSNDVSLNNVKLQDLNDRILVVMLADIIEEGSQDIETVRPQIEFAVKKEKRAEVLKAQFEEKLLTTTSIDKLASAMSATVEQVNTLSFSSNTVPGGYEPDVVGAFYGLEKGQMSSPVVGNNGVYVLFADDFKKSVVPKDFDALKKQLEAQLQPRASFEAYNALKEIADIEDNRAKFY